MTNNFVLTDYAYSSILDMILSSEIKPGERIREDILAEKFGISRTPVREAINRLVQNGFVVNIKRKGLYCVKITKSELLDLLELRTALESISFNKCIDLATDEDIEFIKGIIDDFNHKYDQILRAADSNSNKEIAQLHNTYDVKFHVSIANISKSNKLIKYITEIENTLLIARQRIYRNTNEGKSIVLLSWKQHELMLESIQSKDKTAAIEMLHSHLKLMRDTQVDIDESDRVNERYIADEPGNATENRAAAI
jgi:DNA-binding GntR family transcriptional regulator